MKRVVLVALILTLVAAARPQSGLASAQPITIGAVYPTGGSQASGGTEEYRGVQLAADYVNARNGVGGRPIRLELAPADSYDAAPGAVEHLAASGIAIIVGSYGSTISRPAAGGTLGRERKGI